MVDREKLAQILSGPHGIVAAYFFRSQSSRKTDAFSDYDFAALLPVDRSKDRRWMLVEELLDKAFAVIGQDRVDVVEMSNQPLWF